MTARDDLMSLLNNWRFGVTDTASVNAAIDALVAEARAEGAAEVRERVGAELSLWAMPRFQYPADRIRAALDGDQKEGDHA